MPNLAAAFTLTSRGSLCRYHKWSAGFIVVACVGSCSNWRACISVHVAHTVWRRRLYQQHTCFHYLADDQYHTQLGRAGYHQSGCGYDRYQPFYPCSTIIKTPPRGGLPSDRRTDTRTHTLVVWVQAWSSSSPSLGPFGVLLLQLYQCYLHIYKDIRFLQHPWILLISTLIVYIEIRASTTSFIDIQPVGWSVKCVL